MRGFSIKLLSVILISSMLAGFIPGAASAFAFGVQDYEKAESVVKDNADLDAGIQTRAEKLSERIPVLPGQQIPGNCTVIDDPVYGHVVGYELKKGHTLCISDDSYEALDFLRYWDEKTSLKNKTLSVLGDSISTFAGYVPTADGYNLEHLSRYPQDNLLTDVNETWWMQLVDRLGARLGINDSWRGATVSGAHPVTTGATGEDAAMFNLQRIKNLGANGTPDVIVLFGGSNDYAHVSKLGSFDAASAPTEPDFSAVKYDNLADGYVETLLRFRYFYPDALVISVLPGVTKSYYSNDKLAAGNTLLKRICDHYGVPYVDLYESDLTVGMLPDGIHPNVEGMDVITDVLIDLIRTIPVKPGENTVYPVSHTLTNAKASLSYYKGVTEGAAFAETVTGKDLSVTVMMGGKDITANCYADGVINIPAVTGEIQITVTGTNDIFEGHLSALPENICAGVNLWSILPHDPKYYSPNQGWGYTTVPAPSVTFEIQPGEKIYASSFGKIGENGSDKHSGIRVTFFSDNGVLVSLDPGAIYSEFEQNGFITAPDGAKYVNVPMWGDNAEWELYLPGRGHDFGGEAHGVCSICGKGLLEMLYDDRLDVSDKEVSIIDAGTPTSYKAGSGGSTPDDAVICLDSGKLIACGIGTATVSIDGTVYTVNVTAAPISLFMITGHSIGAGVKGDASLSALCPDGQVYSSFGTNNLPAAVSGLGIGFAAENKPPKIYALNKGGGGTVGEGGGLGLYWNRLTGEKVWIINVAVGGTCLKNWLPETTAYANAVSQYKRAAQILNNEIAAGHYTLSHTGVIYHSAANYSYQNVEFTDEDLQTWFSEFWGGLKSELDADINGDGKGDAPEFCAFVPIWTKSAMYTYNTDKPATYYMSASAEYPDMFTASVCCRDWLTDGGVADSFPTPDYTMQNGTEPDRPLTFSEVFASDRVHLQQISYNALGEDIAADIYRRIYGSNGLTSFSLMHTDGVTGVSDSVSFACGESLTLVPVTEPVTVSSLRFEASGTVEIVYPLTVIPKHNGSGMLNVYDGDTLIRSVQFVCTGFDDRIDMRYDDRYDVSGKEVTIIGAGTPTSYKVGYGVTENTPDEAVVRLENSKLIACGIGEATVSIDGVVYTVNVKSAPISLLLLIGQSNMRGSEGNADQSIVCPEGQVYATYGDDRGASNTEFTVSTARYFAASALAGEYSSVNVEGTAECLSGYPLYTLCEEGAGKMGPDSGFAYEWVKATGEKVWVVNAAHGGTAISAWQKGGKEYNEALLLFTACRETLQKEIAAGHYTLSHMGYFWCQGCSDASQTAEWYINKFTAMHQNLKADNTFDHDLDPSTPDITFEFAGIIPILHGLNSYRAGVYNDPLVGAHYESYRTLTFNGPRAAQYFMCSDPDMPDVYMVCDIGAGWMRMPDGSDGVAAYFESHYENGTVNYQTQVPQSASWYKPTTPAAVHDTIHYNQIGYNEVGIESARNMLILLGVLPDTEEETTVKFVNWTGYEEVSEITARKSASSETLIVPIVSPCYRSKQVTYTVSEGLNYSYYDLTASSSDVTGTLTAHGAEGFVSVVPREYKTFRFETDNGSFISVGETENKTSFVSGGMDSGVFTNARIALYESVMLDHDQSWALEIKMTGPWYSDSMPKLKKLLSADGAASTVGAYNLIVGGNNSRIWLGYYNGTTHVGCGINLAEYGISMSDTHIYRLYNQVNEDGTNQILLYVDGQFVAPMTRYITGDNGDTGTESQMLCGVDLHFGYLGAVNYPLDNGSIEYLHIIESGADENTHIHDFGTWQTVTLPSAEGPGTDRRECSLCGLEQTRAVDGVWQKYALSDHLQQMPEYVCRDLNLWAVLPHDTYYFASGRAWGTHSSGTVHSVTIPIIPGERIYASSFGKAAENGHPTSNGIRTTFFDIYGILKTYEPSQVYAEFSSNGGYITAPEGAAYINIAMWTDTDEWEIYLLDRDHTYFTTVTEPTCTEGGFTSHICGSCGQGDKYDYTEATGHTVVNDLRIMPTNAKNGFTEGSHCSVCGEVFEAQQIIPAKGYDWMTEDGKFKVMFIGGSYSEDATNSGQGMTTSLLLDALQALLGDDIEITVGLCYAGGKAIAWHATQAERDTKIYSLRIITTGGTWNNVGKYTSAEALSWTDWDAVVLQPSQAEARNGVDSNRNGDSEDEKFYDYDASVPYMLDHISAYAPQAEIYYYELWATNKNTEINTGLSAYNMIASVTLDAMHYIGTNNSYVFSDAVPVGAAIQTARTTYLTLLNYNQDETITLETDPQFGLQRDVSHLSFNIGRYIAAMTFAETLIPEELRVEGYSLPPTRVTESVGVLPREYGEIAREAIRRAVSRWHGAEQTLTVLPIEGYETDPTPGTAEALSGYVYTVCRTDSSEKLLTFIKHVVGEKLPEDYHVEKVEIEYSPIPEADPLYKVTIRYGYTFASFYASVIVADHSYETEITLPTCTEQGFTTYTCTHCGFTYVGSYTGPLGHDYTSAVTAPTCTEQGYTTYTCSRCGDSYADNYTDALGHNFENGICTVCSVAQWDTDGDGVLEILAIGNSFSENALRVAYQIARGLGIKNIVIGHLYIAGSSLNTHATNAVGDLAKYTYYYNDNGSWVQTDNYKISTALESRSWDYVSMQQVSKLSGVESTYNEDLTDLIAYVKARSDAKLVWHMTWAYQQDPTLYGFATYNKDQMTMYNAIVSATLNKIVTNSDFDLIVPNGTAVQNARTSLLGDNITQDGYHMSNDYGCYLTGLMFIRTVTGLPVDNITYIPSNMDELKMAIAIESVNNAYINPFDVTNSIYVHTHSYTSTVTDPTCTEQGYTTYTCACGDSYIDDYVDALGHDYVSTVTEPTCTEAGYTTYVCSRCEDTYIDEHTDALGHDFGAWLQIYAPTCAAEGKDERECAVCGEKEYRDTRAAGTDALIQVSSSLPDGYFTGKKIVCIGDSITAGSGATVGINDYVTVLGQLLGADMTRLGLAGSVMCTGGHKPCNYEKLGKIPAYADIVTVYMGVNDWDHARSGENGYYGLGEPGTDDTTTFYGALKMWCDKVAELKALPEYENTVFIFCTPTITSWNVQVTSEKDWDPLKQNQCGYTLRDYCVAIMQVCASYGIPVLDLNVYSGLYYNSSDDNNAVSLYTDGIHPNPQGHAMIAAAISEFLYDNYSYEARETGNIHTFIAEDFAPTCTEQGFRFYVCSDCHYSYKAEYTDALGHDYVSAVTEPTCTEAGYTTHVCSRCEDTYVDEHTDALGHDLIRHDGKPASCTEHGWSDYDTCSRCDFSTYEEIPPAGHSYGRPVFVWSVDMSSAKAVFTCGVCGDETETEAEISSRTVVTEERENVTVFTASVQFGGVTYTDEKQRVNFVYGDVDGDGKTDGKDLIRLRRYLATYDDGTGNSPTEISDGADVNGDGRVDGRDLIRLRKYLMQIDCTGSASILTIAIPQAAIGLKKER